MNDSNANMASSRLIASWRFVRGKEPAVCSFAPQRRAPRKLFQLVSAGLNQRKIPLSWRRFHAPCDFFQPIIQLCPP